MELLTRANKFSGRTAIISNGKSYTYDYLINASNNLASILLNDDFDLSEEPIAFMASPSFNYTRTQWGIWKAGGIAVPLCDLHPLEAIEHVLVDTGAKKIVVESSYCDFLDPIKSKLNLDLIIIEEIDTHLSKDLPKIESGRRAMILYTSGTTSKPKGVVTTHNNLEFQIKILVDAWKWNKTDHILNVLPLHHVHGIINAMSCAFWVGACCEFQPKFNAEKVWEKFNHGRINLFMAVPTIYYKLIDHWQNCSGTQQIMYSNAVKKFRLMVSGSAALPISTLEKWKKISGHTLLERYGMTEIGMALSNPYLGDRRPGHVGFPLSGVSLRLVSENKVVPHGTEGEIQIKGSSVFLEYWKNKDATKRAFTEDGWFLTGDIAICKDGYYKILGRDSIDIIKSGGYKISALEIEEVLRKHSKINECAVIGVPNEEWGEVIVAFIVSPNKWWDTKELKGWLKTKLPAYKIPREFCSIEKLPRNTLGKVTKNELKKIWDNN